MENLDISSLRTLVLFAELGSLAQASERVGRTQAAVSLQLRRLEAQVGCPIFEKRGRKLHLNESGLRLLDCAQRMIQLNDEALTHVRSRLTGRVTLGLTQDLAEEWILPILHQFRIKHPDVQVHVRVDRNYLLQKAVSASELDLAIIANKRPPSKNSAGITAQMVWVSKGRPIRHETRHETRLEKRPLQLILFDAPCLFRSEAIDHLKKSDVPFEISFTSSSLAAIWAAVRAGLGVTLRSSLAVPKDLSISERISPKAGSLGTVYFSLVQIRNSKEEAVQTLYESLKQAFLR